MYDYLTIPQTCAFCRQTSRRWNQAVVDRYIKLFGLPPRARVGQLSKGMKSQLALSLALGSEPDLLDPRRTDSRSRPASRATSSSTR